MNPQHKITFSTLGDEDIIARMREHGETFLFEIIYSRYHYKVQDKCYTLVKNRELAEELSGDIMARTYEKLDSFKGTASFSTWLYSITYNYCIDYLREKKKLHYPEWNSKHELPEIPDEEIDNDEIVSYDQLMVLMDKLHPEEKALLLMKYHDDLSLKQISESLRVTESAVKMRLKRAKNRLLWLHSQNKS